MTRMQQLVGVVLAASVLAVAGSAAAVSEGDTPRVSVCDREGCLSVEVAADEPARRRGLQFRKSLPPDEGMLFVFDEAARHAFWMKDTLIPLDIVWLNERGRVVYLLEGVKPCPGDPCPVYRPREPARMVLEVSAGVAARRGWRSGTILTIKGLETGRSLNRAWR